MNRKRNSNQVCATDIGVSSVKIVGMGSAGIDYLAQVAEYPQPDDKIRTEKLEVHGGGNCGNALTAAARLGLSPYIITKIGGDALGDEILNEFTRDGISTGGILRAAGKPSPFTYIIVDRKGGTRTCIHTPGDAFSPLEITKEALDDALDSATLVYFDGRLAEAAIVLAREAKSRQIPILVEGERLREGLDELLALADYIITSERFPMEWTGEKNTGLAMAAMLRKLPQANWIITTMGKNGSLLLERCLGEMDQISMETNSNSMMSLDKVDDVIQNELQNLGMQVSNKESASVNGVHVTFGRSQTCPEVIDVCSESQGGESSQCHCKAIFTVASAANVAANDIVDTTGAGDAFIGTMLFSICRGFPLKEAMKLSAVVAAMNCTALGARGGMPTLDELNTKLVLEETGIDL